MLFTFIFPFLLNIQSIIRLNIENENKSEIEMKEIGKSSIKTFDDHSETSGIFKIIMSVLCSYLYELLKNLSNFHKSLLIKLVQSNIFRN